MKVLYVLILTMSVFASLRDAAGQSAPSEGVTALTIDRMIEQKMSESGIVGLGAAIIVDRKMVWAKGFGYADIDAKKPFTLDTVMNIGSITKNITGACMLKAVEEGKLSLDEDINRYLPFNVVNPHYPNEKITLRNIATHTSGLADRHPFYVETYKPAGEPDEELGVFLKNYFDPQGKYYAKENFLNRKPGTFYMYSNIAAALAGYIVERATGKKLQEYGKQVVFKPLKMKNTGWSLSEIKLTRHTKLYDKTAATLKTVPLYTFPTYPDGGIRTSVGDLAKYFAALLGEGEHNGARILRKESVKEMQTLQFNESNKPDNVNLAKQNMGLFWGTKMGATRVGHNGSDPGIRTFMLTDLTREIGVVLFINTSVSDDRVPFTIYDELYKYGLKLKEMRKR